MKTLYKILIALCLILWQACSDNEDLSTGRGEIYSDGYVYPIKNVYHRIDETTGVDHNAVPFSSYYHALIFTGDDWGTRVILEIRSENTELSSDEFHVGLTNINYEHNSIQQNINLADDYVHYAHWSDPSSRKMDVSFTKNGDMYDVEIKYVDDDAFLIKWKGPIQNDWW